MRRIAITSVIALAGCRSPERNTCDLETLAELGNTLASMPIARQMNHVWPGLVEACGDAIPPPLMFYFVPESRGEVLLRERDPWSAALQHAACPNWDGIVRAHRSSSELSAEVVFAACDLARYEVLAADEVVGPANAIMVWATHQWLLDQGLDARAAAPMTRALFAREQFEWWGIERMDDLRWPKAHGVPVGNGIPVHVAREQLDERELHEVFVERVELTRTRDDALVIVADVETPMATVLRTLELAERAGFARHGVLVEPESFEPTYIPIGLAAKEPTSTESRVPVFMSIELAPEGLTLSRGHDRSNRENHELGDLQAVWTFAAAVRRDDPQARRVVITTADTIPLEQALAVIEAARGVQCSENGDGCVLPEVLLASADSPPSDRDPKPATGILNDSGIVLRSDDHFLNEDPPSNIEVKGKLDPYIVEEIIAAHVQDLRGCYIRGRTYSAPPLEVTLDFTITRTGKTQDPKVGVANSSVRSCITKTLRRWQFPKPDDGKPVTVNYAFELDRYSITPLERP